MFKISLQNINRKYIIWIAISISIVFFVHYLPSILLAVMFLAGRSDCSFSKTVGAMDWEAKYYDSKRKMEKGISLLKKDGNLELWKTPRGYFWMPKGRGSLKSSMLSEQEMSIYGSGAVGVQPGDVVIDCGADVGMFTRTALDSGASLVIAVEPAATRLPCLQRNFQREIAEHKVVVYPKGVWNNIKSLPLYGDSVVYSRSTSASPTEIIQLTTIDTLVSDLGLQQVNYIKMDIEGAEKQALEGARSTLIRFKPRMAIACEHFKSDAKDIPRLVLDIVPTYRVECGPCVHWGDRFYPYVVNFH